MINNPEPYIITTTRGTARETDHANNTGRRLTAISRLTQAFGIGFLRKPVKITRNGLACFFCAYLCGLAFLMVIDYGSTVLAQDYLNGGSKSPTSGQRPPQGLPQKAVAGTTKSPANGLPSIDQPVGDWRMQCAVQPQRYCRAFQVHINPVNQALLLRVEASLTAEPSTLEFAVLTPLGLRVLPAMTVEVDGTNQMQIPIVTCRSDGCVYAAKVQRDAIRGLWTAKTLIARLTTLEGASGNVNISVNGLGEVGSVLRKYADVPSK